MGTEGHGFSRRPSRNFKPPVFHQLRADAHSNGPDKNSPRKTLWIIVAL